MGASWCNCADAEPDGPTIINMDTNDDSSFISTPLRNVADFDSPNHGLRMKSKTKTIIDKKSKSRSKIKYTPINEDTDSESSHTDNNDQEGSSKNPKQTKYEMDDINLMDQKTKTKHTKQRS